jgi:hypothetical protein
VIAKRPLLVSVLVVAAFLTASLILLPPYFETNDDAFMSLIAAGRVYTDTPDEHLLFTNVLVGLGLSALYRVAPDFPWYGSYLLAIMGASVLCLSYSLLRANVSGKQLAFVVGLMVAFLLPGFAHPQFTRVAFLATLAGLVSITGTPTAPVPRSAAWAGAIMVILGALVRFYAALLACVVFAPVLAVRCTQAVRGCAAWRPLFVLSGALAVGLGADLFNRWYYARDNAWQEFYRFNALRVHFTDYARFEDNAALRRALAAAGWCRADLAMIRNWNFADPERFSVARLQSMLDAMSREGCMSRRPSPGEWLAKLRSDWELPPLLLTGAACLIFMGGGWRARMLPLACLASAIVVTFLLFLYLHLPERVSFSAFGVFAFAAALDSSSYRAARKLEPWSHLVGIVSALLGFVATVVLLACVAVALVFCVCSHRAACIRGRERQERAAEMLARLQPREEQLFVLWADAFPTEDIVAPFRSLTVSRAFKALDLGGSARTPLGTNRLVEFGIRDLYLALVERPQLFLASDEPGNRVLAAYMKEHYGVRLGGRVVFSHAALGPTHIYAFTDLNRMRSRGAEP